MYKKTTEKWWCVWRGAFQAGVKAGKMFISYIFYYIKQKSYILYFSGPADFWDGMIFVEKYW